MDLTKIKNDFEELALVQESNGVWLFGYGTYSEGSVLEGQDRLARIECFDTMEQAQKECPGVTVEDFKRDIRASVPHTPPRDWSPADAGEAWGENDY